MILSIDTATPVCSVALHQEGALRAYAELRLENAHAETLAALVAQVLENTSTTPAQLQAIAISEGPGSYTGLRIGTALAKGMCFSLGVPLLAVSTLQAMAAEARLYVPQGTLLCPMLDARRMEVYTALYDGTLQTLQPVRPLVIEEGAFAEQLQAGPVAFFGDGSEKCQDLLAHPNAHFLNHLRPSARFVGELATAQLAAGQTADVAYFEPLYLKEFQVKKKGGQQ